MAKINNKEEMVENNDSGGESNEAQAREQDKLTLMQHYKETILNLCSSRHDYNDKVEKLLESWNYIALILQESTQDTSDGNLLHWVLKYTVRLILVGDWIKIPQDKRDAIKSKIEEIIPKLQHKPMSIYRCEYILKNIENPWGDEKLLNVLRGDPWIVSESDMQFLTDERGCMILLRLQKLCETKCDDMAFAWSSKALSAYRSVNSKHALKKSTSSSQLSFLFEVYLCYLHKYGHVSKIIDEVKHQSLVNAPKLLLRFLKPNEELSRFAKYRQRIARLISDILVAELMVEELNESNEYYYCDILKKWLHLHKSDPVVEFRKIARKLYMTAISRKHIYLACDIIKQMDVTEWRDLVLELCVRGITGELNELELLKSEKSCDENIVIQHEINLSDRYIYLADILKNHSHLAQECILTAFSLNPTEENYLLVKDIALKIQKNEHKTINFSFFDNTSKPHTESVSPSTSISSSINNQTQKQPVENDLDLCTENVSTENTIPDVSEKSESSDVSVISQKPIRIIARYPSMENSGTMSKSKSAENLAYPSDDTETSLEVPCETVNKSKPAAIRAHRASIDVLYSITGSNKIFESPSYNALSAPSLILDSIESMDLPLHIRVDLSVLLNTPRLKILSWMLPWHELDAHCQKLLKTDCKLSIVRQSLAVANDRLQYLNLDYDQFKHLPESECPGIEKGYEIYSIDSDDDDAVSLSDENFTPNSHMSSGKKRTTKKAKEAKDKLSKSQKKLKEKVPRPPKKSLKQQIKNTKEKPDINNPYNLIRESNLQSTSQKAQEHEALMRALYQQQFQHQLQLSRSLMMLNQHTQVNRNFFLPYCPQLQERVQTERDAMPPPPTIPTQKTPQKSSSAKIQMKESPFQFRMQQQLKSQLELQYLQSQSQNQSQLSALIRSMDLKTNPTLVKLAILQNISQKLLIQKLHREQANASKLNWPSSPNLFLNQFVLSQQNNPSISIQREIPSATVTSAQNALLTNLSTSLQEATTSSQNSTKLSALLTQPKASRAKKVISTGKTPTRVVPSKKVKSEKLTNTKNKANTAPTVKTKRNESVQIKSASSPVHSSGIPTSSFCGMFPKGNVTETNTPTDVREIPYHDESSTESAPESLSITTAIDLSNGEDSFSSDLVCQNVTKEDHVVHTFSDEFVLSNSNVQEEHNYFSKNFMDKNTEEIPNSVSQEHTTNSDTNEILSVLTGMEENNIASIGIQASPNVTEINSQQSKIEEGNSQQASTLEDMYEVGNLCQEIIEDWSPSGTIREFTDYEVEVPTSNSQLVQRIIEDWLSLDAIKTFTDFEVLTPNLQSLQPPNEVNEVTDRQNIHETPSFIGRIDIVRDNIFHETNSPIPPALQDDEGTFEISASEVEYPKKKKNKYQLKLSQESLKTLCNDNNFDINAISDSKVLPISILFKNKEGKPINIDGLLHKENDKKNNTCKLLQGINDPKFSVCKKRKSKEINSSATHSHRQKRGRYINSKLNLQEQQPTVSESILNESSQKISSIGTSSLTPNDSRDSDSSLVEHSFLNREIVVGAMGQSSYPGDSSLIKSILQEARLSLRFPANQFYGDKRKQITFKKNYGYSSESDQEYLGVDPKCNKKSDNSDKSRSDQECHVQVDPKSNKRSNNPDRPTSDQECHVQVDLKSNKRSDNPDKPTSDQECHVRVDPKNNKRSDTPDKPTSDQECHVRVDPKSNKRSDNPDKPTSDQECHVPVDPNCNKKSDNSDKPRSDQVCHVRVNRKCNKKSNNSVKPKSDQECHVRVDPKCNKKSDNSDKPRSDQECHVPVDPKCIKKSDSSDKPKSDQEYHGVDPKCIKKSDSSDKPRSNKACHGVGPKCNKKSDSTDKPKSVLSKVRAKRNTVQNPKKETINDDKSGAIYERQNSCKQNVIRRVRRTTLNINYLDSDSSSESDNLPLKRVNVKPIERKKSVEIANLKCKVIKTESEMESKLPPKQIRSHRASQRSVAPIAIKSDNINTQNIIQSDVKLFGQEPIVQLSRCDENYLVKRNELDEIIVLSLTSSDSDDVELISEEYIARPRRKTQIYKIRASPQPRRVKKIYLKNIRSSKIAIVNESSCSSPRPESEVNEVHEIAKVTEPIAQPIVSMQRRRKLGIRSKKRRHSAFEKYLIRRRLGSKSPALPKQRSVSQPQVDLSKPVTQEISRPTINNDLPELRLTRLDNLTMLRYNQQILVNGVLVVSPRIYLKRLQINNLPIKISDTESKKKKRRQRLTKRKHFPQHLQPILQEELRDWNIQSRHTQNVLQIDLKSEADIPTKQWNNLDMFQVSSDDDSISETEPRKPTKISRIDNKLTKNCNVTNAANKEEQPPRNDRRHEGKKNLMFDIYSVVVKPDFVEAPNVLFNCKKTNFFSKSIETSNIFLAIATKLIVESLVESEENRKHLDQVLNDMINFWLPQVLTRQYLKQVTTKILFSIRNVLRKTISSAASQKSGCKRVNETLEERTSKFYLNKKLFNSMLTRSNEDKCTSNKKLSTYYELRKMIYRRTLGEKLDNKIKPFDNINTKSNGRKDQLSKRLLCKVPGFCTLEYFTAPSFHCLPVVRIVHSTLPLDEKDDASAGASSSEASTDIKISVINQEATQKSTLVPLLHKQFNSGNRNETAASNVRVIIPHVSTTKKGLKPPNNNTGINSTTFIKVDKNVSDRKARLEQNFVLLECNNSNKLVPIKKDDRILLASTTNRTACDTASTNVQECRLLESSTFKSAPKIAVANEKFIVGSSSNTTLLPVKFIYKSEGGMIHLTPLSGHTSIQNISLTKDIKEFSLVKTDMKNSGTIDSVNSPLSIISTRSLYEENYAKFIQTSSTSTPLQSTAVVRTVVQQSSHTSEPPSLVNATLPKFTQAFGKKIHLEGSSKDEKFSDEETATKKNQIKQAPAAGGDILLAKQNVTISSPIISTVETFTRNKASKMPTTRIITGARQQVKIVQTDSGNSSISFNAGLNGQRTALLSPLPISAPIVSQASISNYVQTRYVRPFFQISQNSLQATPPQSQQQVLITTAHPSVTTVSSGTTQSFSLNNLIVSSNNNGNIITPNTAAKLKCLPTLTVTKCEKPLISVEKKKSLNGDTPVDTSTLEQLREFDLVFEQVKERSTTATITTAKPENEAGAVEMETKESVDISVINKQEGPERNVTPSPVKNVDNIKKSSEENSRAITTRENTVNFTLFQKSPVVVVTNNLAQTLVTSKPKIITEREDKSAREVRTTQATQTIQTSVSTTPQAKLVPTKGKSPQKPTTCAMLSQTTTYSQKISKPQEDEQTVQRIYDILAEYAEQLRNSPDLNNKPAPRRRSNPLNSCNISSKKRKMFLQRPSDGSFVSNEMDQIMDSEDSSCGTLSLCNRSPIHDSSTSVDNSNHFVGRQQLIKTEGVFAIVDGQNKICTATNSTKVVSSSQQQQQQQQQQPAVNVINFDISNETQPNRTTTKATAVFVPCKYILPLNAINSEVIRSVEDKKITTPAKQIMYKTKTVKVADCLINQKIAFRPISFQNVRQPIGLVQNDQSSQVKTAASMQKTAIVFQAQQPTFSTTIQQQKNSLNIMDVASVDNISTNLASKTEEAVLELKQKSNRVQETSVITKVSPAVKQSQRLQKGEDELKKQNPLNNKKVHNTNFLSTSPQSTTLTKLQKEITKKASDKIKNNLRLDSSYKSTSSRILTQLNEGRRLALEREMKFQKSLSDECEDLGVDEPSTSDLFPEADLLFDPTSSSFENNSQDEIHTIVEEKKSLPTIKDIKVSQKIITQIPVEASNSMIKNSLCGDNVRSACLREVIGWELPDAQSGKTNLVIQHTSNSRSPFLRESTSPSPTSLFKTENWSPTLSSGIKSESESECETVESGGKRRISARGIIKKSNNCPCCTSTTVLTSSTQTMATIACPKDRLYLSKARTMSYQPLYSDMKRMRSIKFNNSDLMAKPNQEDLIIPQHKINKTTSTIVTDTPKESLRSMASLDSQHAITSSATCSTRRVVTNRYLKPNRR